MRAHVLALLLAAALLQGATVPAQSAPETRSEIPFRKDLAPGFDSGRWALGVTLALGIGLGAWWMLRKRLPVALTGLLPNARERRLRLIESLRVSPRTTLLLVEVDGRSLVLAEHAGSLVLLSPSVEPRHA